MSGKDAVNNIFRKSLLYDFYGELLTDHQKEVYEDFVLNDLSLGEIANDRGISRQGVHDLIKRCDKILDDYEEKLHLLERFTETKAKVQKICNIADMAEKDSDIESKHQIISEIKCIANEILDSY